MPLYVVEHQHQAETCPAGDPLMGPMLAQYVSPPNAENFGLTIHGEAVLDGAHTLVLIVDAPEEGTVERFMTPFAQVGTVDIKAANRCETVVARAFC
jgi:hypothetical protein